MPSGDINRLRLDFFPHGISSREEAELLLRSLGLEPELRDVDLDPRLSAEYDFRVPVVLLDGRVVGEGRVSREALERALRLLGRRVPRTRLALAAATLVQVLVQVAHTLLPRIFVARRRLEEGRADLLTAHILTIVAVLRDFALVGREHGGSVFKRRILCCY